MGENKPNVENLIRRIDDLIRILKFLSEDLAEISRNVKASTNVLTPAPQVKPLKPLSPPRSAQQTITSEAPSPVITGTARTTEDVQKAFPKELANMLYFEMTDEYVLVKPRQYLGSDNFRRIATIVRDQLGGEYVSAGRDSHFRIPRVT